MMRENFNTEQCSIPSGSANFLIFNNVLRFSDVIVFYFMFWCWVLLYISVLYWLCSLLKTTLTETLCTTRYMAFLGLYWWELLWSSRYSYICDVIGLLYLGLCNCNAPNLNNLWKLSNCRSLLSALKNPPTSSSCCDLFKELQLWDLLQLFALLWLLPNCLLLICLLVSSPLLQLVGLSFA